MFLPPEKIAYTLWRNPHQQRSSFFVGRTCVAHFNQDQHDMWDQEEHDVMPSYLRTVDKLGTNGVAKIHEHNIVTKGR